MKFGYPCINYSLLPLKNMTFHLKSYTKAKALSTIENNLYYLQQMLEFNVKHNILFFRISSDLIPFASHPVNALNWVEIFKLTLLSIGQFISKHKIRISMQSAKN